MSKNKTYIDDIDFSKVWIEYINSIKLKKRKEIIEKILYSKNKLSKWD